MTNPLAVLRQVTHGTTGERLGAHVLVWCPGCDGLHAIGVRGDDGSRPGVEWEWDGDLEAPTVSPSILVKGGRNGPGTVCHSYLEGGRWRFLDDSTHTFAGVTEVPMVPLPDWLLRD